MAIDLSEFEAFTDALRRTTGILLIVEEALSRSTVLTADAGWRGGALTDGGALQPAVGRPGGSGGFARPPMGPGAEVTPVGVQALAGLVAPILEIVGVLGQIVGTLHKTAGIADSLAQPSANFHTALEQLRSQSGASGAEIEKFGDTLLKQAQGLQQMPAAYAQVFGKLSTLDLDKGVAAGDLSKRVNTAAVSTAVSQIATVRTLPVGDLAEVVTPLLAPVQDNMAAVNRRLAQIYAVYADAPLPDALMKTGFAPLVNRVQDFGATESQAIGSATTLLDFAKRRAGDPAQAVKATEELFAQLNDAEVRSRFKDKGIDIAALREQARRTEKDPLVLIANAINDSGKFNQKDLDVELKSVLKERQSTVLLADIVKNNDEFAVNSKKVSDQNQQQSFLDAFKTRQATALGTYTAGKIGLETTQIGLGFPAMQGIGWLGGKIGDGVQEAPDIWKMLQETIKKLFEQIGRSQMPLDGQTIPWQSIWPMSFPVERLRQPMDNPPSLQDAGFRYWRDQPPPPPPAPVKTELTIHLTGLAPGMSAEVVSESERFMTKVYSGYNIHSF